MAGGLPVADGSGVPDAVAEPDAATVDELFAHLREQILDGDLVEGAVLSQVQLARELGVNRTPLREALRMLQREGLVDAQYNRRVRVSRLSTADLEQLYAERIVTESLGIRLTVPTFATADIEQLRELLREMDGLATAASFADWEEVHRRFHARLVAGAGERLTTRIDHLGAYARRYRHALSTMGHQAVDGFAQGAVEHAAIVDACADRDVEQAGALMARHLARTALTLISVREPTHDPVTVREAVRMVAEPAS
jgi:DNA-binding GntR family transcriptional regulator